MRAGPGREQPAKRPLQATPGPDLICAPCSRGYHHQCIAGCADLRGASCACYPQDPVAQMDTSPEAFGIGPDGRLPGEPVSGRDAVRALERRYAAPWMPR